MTSSALAGPARLHLRLRHLGTALFAVAVLGLVVALVLAVTGGGTRVGVVLYLLAAGFSLSTFGLHDETALALLVRVGARGLEPDLVRELGGALAADRVGVRSLAPASTSAWVVTAGALLLHLLAAWRLGAALGGA